MPSGTPQYITIFECDLKDTGCEYPCRIIIGPHKDGDSFVYPKRCPYSDNNKGISWSKRKLEVS